MKRQRIIAGIATFIFIGLPLILIAISATLRFMDAMGIPRESQLIGLVLSFLAYPRIWRFLNQKQKVSNVCHTDVKE